MAEPGSCRRPWNVLFYYTGTFRDGTVTGAEIAEAEFLKAIVAHRLFRRLQIVTQLPEDQQQQLAAFLGIDGRSDVSLGAIRDIRALVAASPPDLALCPYIFQFQLDPIRTEHRFPVCGYVHTISTLDAKSSLARNLRMPDHGLDVALCPTRSVEKALRAMAADLPGVAATATVSSRIVPLGLDPDFVRPVEAAERERLRTALGIAQDEIVFLYVGRLSPWTKMDLLPLLDAFARASERTSAPLRLRIVGQEQANGYVGVLRARCAQLRIADKVVIIDDARRETLPSTLAAVDAFVSPSDNRQETFGLTLVEAMAAGLPVIAADWNGYSDVLGADGGLLVPSLAIEGDEALVQDLYYRGVLPIAAQMSQTSAISIPHLAQAMARVAQNPAFRHDLARSARQRFLTRFRWDNVIEALIETWDGQVAAAERLHALTRARPQPELALDLDACFRHYPSRGWSDAAELWIVRAPDDDHDLLLASIARAAHVDWPRCVELRSRLMTGASRTLDALLDPGEPSALDRRSIAFLIKHGVIDIDWDALRSNAAREEDDAVPCLSVIGERPATRSAIGPRG